MSYFLKSRRFQISHRHFSLYKRFLEIKKHLIDLINIIDTLFDEILYNEVPFPGMRQGIPSLSQKLLQFREGEFQGDPQSERRCPRGLIIRMGPNLRKKLPIQIGFLIALRVKLATPISNGGLFGTPPGFCTDTCLWQV